MSFHARPVSSYPVSVSKCVDVPSLVSPLYSVSPPCVASVSDGFFSLTPYSCSRRNQTAFFPRILFVCLITHPFSWRDPALSPDGSLPLRRLVPCSKIGSVHRNSHEGLSFSCPSSITICPVTPPPSHLPISFLVWRTPHANASSFCRVGQGPFPAFLRFLRSVPARLSTTSRYLRSRFPGLTFLHPIIFLNLPSRVFIRPLTPFFSLDHFLNSAWQISPGSLPPLFSSRPTSFLSRSLPYRRIVEVFLPPSFFLPPTPPLPPPSFRCFFCFYLTHSPPVLDAIPLWPYWAKLVLSLSVCSFARPVRIQEFSGPSRLFPFAFHKPFCVWLSLLLRAHAGSSRPSS